MRRGLYDRDFVLTPHVASANAGGGVKIFLTQGLFIAPDVRMGHEPSFRATVGVGYVFAGRKRGE